MLARLFLIVTVILFLSGCSVVNEYSSAPESQHPALDTLSSPVENQESPALLEGARIQVTTPLYPQPLQAVVEQSYMSALGQHCCRIKALELESGHPYMAMCKDATGQWHVVPSVQSYPLRQNCGD